MSKWLAILAVLAAQDLSAQIVSSAMLAFPATTEYVEYDNLYALRRLPNYAVLRQRFSGKALEEAKAALSRLGIDESQVHEVVMGTSATAFYGLLDGTFTQSVARKTALKNGIAPTFLESEPVYCVKGAACILFMEDSLAAFGTFDQLKLMAEARTGTITRLSSNHTLNFLMGTTEQRSPVRGVVYGSQLNTVLADALQSESGLNLDWKQVASNVKAFAYSVDMDTRAHVIAKLECSSSGTAALLRQMLSALGGVESMATKVGKDPASMPFSNMQTSASGNYVDLRMDAPLPAS